MNAIPGFLQGDDGEGPVEAAPRQVHVEAPARLHLGFLDPAGSLGRPFGSLGLTIDAPCTRLTLAAAADGVTRVEAAPGVPPEEAERAAAHLALLERRTGRSAALRLRLHEVLPPHAGFGSGTQLALAVGRAFLRWHRLDLPSAQLAQWLGRGLRSGIGIAGFDQGGLLLDGGPLPDGRPAPLLARLALPPAWRVLLVTEPGGRGLSGAAERAALAGLPPLPREAAACICHETLMRILPGAGGAGFSSFAAGVSAVQTVLGEHFAPAQDGEPFARPAIGRLMRWLAEAAAQPAPGLGPGQTGAGIGQSSWGPTAFALLPSAERARTLAEAARRAGLLAPGLQFQIVAPGAHGARVAVLERGLPAWPMSSNPPVQVPRWNIPTSSTCSPPARR
ncbi:GHMP family kinase ATP-binding protein [Sphaerotilus uruguayifluvii]|uniref:Beta-RFAP synthase n=1 Tax=Sphaerotilus uruguayifluvii TaxID=2735897 RepID=A0ABX2FZF8_9BURK|nr:beta-ribofuranosylaminobenzene 5'-phosphate synthase [Leptothrix sp. C29]NRT55165.1 beta-RFAP synthase [Leptothrix sp. C29]